MRSKNNHPWRESSPGVQTIDPVVSSRSGQFAAYLETLPREERRQIEVAERAFVARSNIFTSLQQSAARDYVEGMLGVKGKRAGAVPRLRGLTAVDFLLL